MNPSGSDGTAGRKQPWRFLFLCVFDGEWGSGCLQLSLFNPHTYTSQGRLLEGSPI